MNKVLLFVIGVVMFLILVFCVSYSFAENNIDHINEYNQLHKSPAIAIMLSLEFPGGGQFYNKQPIRGIGFQLIEGLNFGMLINNRKNYSGFFLATTLLYLKYKEIKSAYLGSCNYNIELRTRLMNEYLDIEGIKIQLKALEKR